MSSLVPSLLVKENLLLIKQRSLPVKGKILVSVGEEVSANQIVAEAEMPGDLQVVKLIEQTGLELDAVLNSLTVKEGDFVKRGQVILSYQTFFGLFETKVTSPTTGKVEFISQTNAHVGIRGESNHLSLKAYLSGKVHQIIDQHIVEIVSNVTYLQGIFGVGGERFGKIKVLNSDDQKNLLPNQIPTDCSGQILVSKYSPTKESLEAIAKSGAQGLIVGSIDNEALKNFLGYELGLPITGNEDVPFTLIVTEGFGSIPMSERYFELLQKLAGEELAINGATQIRAGAVRPEMILANTKLTNHKESTVNSLDLGSNVKVIRYPYFGKIGKITELPVRPEKIDTGGLVRVARLQLSDQEIITVPRANLEILS